MLRRTGFKSKAPARAERDPDRVRATPAPVVGAFRLGGPAELTAAPKDETVRDESYRRLVASLPCILCGVQGHSQAAHPNMGKGTGVKSDDTDCFPLCADRPGVRGCHPKFDQGALFPKEERRAMEAKWAQETKERLRLCQ